MRFRTRRKSRGSSEHEVAGTSVQTLSRPEKTTDSLALVPEAVMIGDLTLRQWQTPDAHALNTALTASYEHVRDWESSPLAELCTAQQRAAQIWTWRRDPDYVPYGCFDAAGNVVGGCNIRRHDDDPKWDTRLGHRYYIGYWVHVDHVRQGHATAMAEALCNILFGLADTAVVDIGCDVANIASRRIPEKLGFELACEADHDYIGLRGTGRACWWELTRKVWESQPRRAIRTL